MQVDGVEEKRTQGVIARRKEKIMSSAYAIFGLAVAIAITFVLTVRMWIEREEKAIGH